MTRPTKSFQSDSINDGQNCLLQRLSKSKVRKKVRCALLSHSTNMSAASCTFQGPKVSCNLQHHDVGLNVSPSKSLFNPPIMLAPHLPELSQLFKCVASQAPVQPAVASHLMGARVFITFSCTLLAMTKASITTYSFPVEDIQLQRLRTFSSSSPCCMVTMQVPSPCSVGCGTCGILQIPCPYELKPPEVVFRQKSTFLAATWDRKGTLSARTSYNLLGVPHTDPPVQSGVIHLAERISPCLLPVVHEGIV